MSERRTAEIKFRCTPTFKASLAAAADATDRSLTEYIESAVESHRTARAKAECSIGGKCHYSGVATHLGGGKFSYDPPLSEYGGPDAPALSVASGFQNRTDDGTEMECAPEAPPQTKCAGNCRPWEFCHCKAEA